MGRKENNSWHFREINLCSETPWELREEKAPWRSPRGEGLLKARGLRTLSLFF